MLGLSSIFLFNFFLHVFCNSTKTSANSSVMFVAILTLCIATPQIKLAFMKVSFEWLDRLEAPEVDY